MMTGSLKKKRFFFFFFFKTKKLKDFFFIISKKRGGPLIRACSLIRSNTVSHLDVVDSYRFYKFETTFTRLPTLPLHYF